MTEKFQGAILMYRSQGRVGVTGQVIGADGSGTYAVVFYGDPDRCVDRAREYVVDLQKHGHRLAFADIARSDDEMYYSMQILHIDLRECVNAAPQKDVEND